MSRARFTLRVPPRGDPGRTRRARAHRAQMALDELMDACHHYCSVLGRRIFFEWTLIDGKNDTADHAHAVGALILGLPAQVNLIPLNPTPGYGGIPSRSEAARRFQRFFRRTTGCRARCASAGDRHRCGMRNWPAPPEGRSIVARRAPEVVEHPDLLPDAIAALVGDLAVVLARALGFRKPSSCSPGQFALRH